jgi:hypothetical protein
MKTHPVFACLLAVTASCLAPTEDAHGEATPPRPTDIAELAPADLREEPALADVALRLRQTSEHDGVWGPTSPRVIANDSLAVGDQAVLMVALGTEGGCVTSMGGTVDSMDRLPASAEGFRHLWLADVRRVSSELGSLRLEARWRQYLDQGDGLGVVFEETRDIVLPEGETHVLGGVGFAGEDPCKAAAVVELSAEVAEDPELADRTLAYDLWYERIDEHGEPVRRRFQGGGLHGETIPFRLPAVRMDASPNDERELFVELHGEIQGRWRTNDAVAIRIAATQSAGIVQPGKSGQLSKRGQELFVVRPGQTIRMDLPPMTGFLSAEGPVAPGEQGRHVDLEARFAGHQEALILTVHGPD